MTPPTLSVWLQHISQLHPSDVDLGLQRCSQVAQQLGLYPVKFPIITVAGTNGKGSSVHLLDAILTAAGYRCGRYTSPELLRYNERISVAGQLVDDELLCEAFSQIDAQRGTISLTHFEFSTLAAMWVFQQLQVEVAVLEVGLGGRLDAVNIFDADIALITAIGIDHSHWLGTDREQIGLEKAGIMRSGKPVVCSDIQMPHSIKKRAAQLNSPLFSINHEYTYKKTQQAWQWQHGTQDAVPLPRPNLAGDFQLHNAAGVLMAVQLLQAQLPVPQQAIEQGLREVSVPGRVQLLAGSITTVLDVAHNPHGATAIAEFLQRFNCTGELHALMSCLADKDITGIVQALQNSPIQTWHIAPLTVPRAASLSVLQYALQQAGIQTVQSYSDVSMAYQHLLQTLPSGDCILVFGSFHTVATVLAIHDNL